MIDRKTASRLLKVSLRTVDRYISKKKLSSEERDGRIWLNKKEILKLKAQKRVDTSKSHLSIDKTHVIIDDMSIDTPEVVYRHTQESPQRKRKIYEVDNTESEEKVYKRLFEELQQEIRIKQERLEGANYRVGQLEARLKDSVPLLDYNRALAIERSEKEQLRKNLDAEQFESEQLLNNLKEERFNKKVYLIILFILLLLQPLWFFFPVK